MLATTQFVKDVFSATMKGQNHMTAGTDNFNREFLNFIIFTYRVDRDRIQRQISYLDQGLIRSGIDPDQIWIRSDINQTYIRL